jgi:nicotinamidase/pyrazinamidase
MVLANYQFTVLNYFFNSQASLNKGLSSSVCSYYFGFSRVHKKKQYGLVTRLSKTINLTRSDALLVTDMQVDFLPGGALPVADADELIPVINDYISRFEEAQSNIIASRDWHPPNHISFKAQGGPWPPHCVQNTKGAKFSPELKFPNHTIVISKATDPTREAYSVFDGTNLADELQTLGVTRLFVAGLATDYCVVNTVLDACKLGFEAVVLMDATLGINVKPGDVDRAIQAMIKSGATQATVADFPNIEDKLPVEEELPDALAEKSSQRQDHRKTARLRSKGANQRIKSERRS